MLSDILSWVGVLTLLIGYILVSKERISPKSTAFHTINFIGATILGVSMTMKHVWAMVFFEIIFIAVALHFIRKNLRA